MKAWRFYALGDMRLDEVPYPSVRPGWVILKTRVVQPSVSEVIRAQGGSTHGSDLVRRYIQERAPVQLLGHEFCAEVVEVGKGITHVKTGDRVTALPHGPCHACPLCLAGYADQCRKGPVVGREIPGLFAEFAAIPAELVMVVADAISDNEAAAMQPLVGCAESVEVAGLTMGDTVVVLGLGVMGLGTMQIARTCGAATVIGLDVREQCLDLGRRLGLDIAINSLVTDPVEAVRQATDGVGPDVVFEAAGGPPEQGLAGSSTLLQAIEMVRNGGRIVQIAHLADEVPLNPDVFRSRNLKYLFPDTGGRRLLKYCIHLVASKRVHLAPMITHVLDGLDKVPQAFEITGNKAKYQATNPAQVVVT